MKNLEKQTIKFELRGIEKLDYGFRAKLVSDKAVVVKTENLGDLPVDRRDKIVYFLYMSELGKGQSAGVPKEPKTYELVHFKLPTGEWYPEGFDIREQIGKKGDYEGVKFKVLIPRG